MLRYAPVCTDMHQYAPICTTMLNLIERNYSLVYRSLFPQGIPTEFALVTTFRVTRQSQTQDWFLWDVQDQFGVPQLAVRLEGQSKVLKFVFIDANGNVQSVDLR